MEFYLLRMMLSFYMFVHVIEDILDA